MNTALNDKNVIRRLVLGKRDSLAPEERRVMDEALRRNFLALPEFSRAEAVLLYASFRSEADTLALIKETLRSGKRVLLPRVSGGDLDIYRVSETGQIETGYMGIPEPRTDAPAAEVSEADLIVLPGSVFDFSGGRLGYGMGFYDKMLARMMDPVPLVALAYELQVWGEELPLEEHDMKVDKIVTEKRVIDCHG